LREIYDNTSYNFCCVVGDKFSYGAYYSICKGIHFRCIFENKYITLWSGKWLNIIKQCFFGALMQ
jgi:hypothetical protein